VREAEENTTAETAYFLLSRVLSPERFNEAVRQHWRIENSLHWRLDVVMNEDKDRTRVGHGPQNQAVLRQMVINATQKEASKGSLRGNLKRAGSDNKSLNRLLELF
jgi:predicted transposase YbfD/YdcC